MTFHGRHRQFLTKFLNVSLDANVGLHKDMSYQPSSGCIAYLSIQELTPLPLGRGSVMLYASHVKLPPRYSAKMGTPRALACSSSSSTSTPVPQAWILAGIQTAFVDVFHIIATRFSALTCHELQSACC
jgi:hypothetical protein